MEAKQLSDEQLLLVLDGTDRDEPDGPNNDGCLQSNRRKLAFGAAAISPRQA